MGEGGRTEKSTLYSKHLYKIGSTFWKPLQIYNLHPILLREHIRICFSLYANAKIFSLMMWSKCLLLGKDLSTPRKIFLYISSNISSFWGNLLANHFCGDLFHLSTYISVNLYLDSRTFSWKPETNRIWCWKVIFVSSFLTVSFFVFPTDIFRCICLYLYLCFTYCLIFLSHSAAKCSYLCFFTFSCFLIFSSYIAFIFVFHLLFNIFESYCSVRNGSL